jgi:hypothetical protein
MDAARAAAKISRGYGIAARVLGPEYAVYRPGDLTHPMVTPIGTVHAMFKGVNAKVGAADKPGDPFCDGYMATAIMEPGDICTGADGVFFVWGKPTLGAILAVQCNEVVSVSRPGPQITPDYYGGACVDTIMMDGWPASVLQRGSGELGPLNLPGDAKFGGTTILLPAPAGVTIRTSDIITTTRARFIVVSAELTDGWRIMAGLEVA